MTILLAKDFYAFLVILALCLSPFSSEGKNILPIWSAGSKVGIGLDPDGFSSALDLMKAVGVFCFREEPSEGPSGDPEEILSSDGSEDVETSPPCDASLWLGVEDFLGLTSIDNFLGFMVQELVGHGMTTMLPKANPVASPYFTFRREMLVMCCIEHRLIESEE